MVIWWWRNGSKLILFTRPPLSEVDFNLKSFSFFFAHTSTCIDYLPRRSMPTARKIDAPLHLDPREAVHIEPKSALRLPFRILNCLISKKQSPLRHQFPYLVHPSTLHTPLQPSCSKILEHSSCESSLPKTSTYIMDSKLTSRIPARIVVNGKSYSPVCTPGSEEDITKLCFSLFQRTASAIQKPGIELRVFAVRAVKGGDSQKSQYHANLLFPADAIINYSHTTPSKVSDIDRAFNNVGEIDLHLWRCLNFSAKEVIIETGPGGVPSLYSERTEVEFARLMNTAKNVNAIPNAVLEVSCLISIHSHDLTDARDTRVANMERAVFLTPPEPSSG